MTKERLDLNTITKIAFCLEGRDKITKILQYGSRLTAWYYLHQDPNHSVGLQCHHLFKASQQARKAFRLGKSINEYKKGIMALEDHVIYISNISNIYLS